MSTRTRRLAGLAFCAGVWVWSGCGVSISDPSVTWPEVEQVQLAVNDMSVRVRRGGGVSGPVPVLRLGENSVMATAFRKQLGGVEDVVQSPRFALQLFASRFVPLSFTADSVNTLSGVLVASGAEANAYVTLQLVEPSTGRIHFGPVTIPIAIANY